MGRGGPRDAGTELPDGTALDGAVREALASFGMDVIEVTLSRAARRLRVMIDKKSDRPPGPLGEPSGVTVDDCALASRAIEGLLRGHDLDPGTFDIAVESPGADRPLTREHDFARFRGRQVTVSLRQARDGRRNFTGELVGYEGGDVTVKVLDQAEAETFRRGDIREVRLHPGPKAGLDEMRGPGGGGGRRRDPRHGR